MKHEIAADSASFVESHSFVRDRSGLIPDHAMRTAVDRVEPFAPHPQHWSYLRAFLDPAIPHNIKAICQAARINRRNVYRWLQDPAFCRWFSEQCDSLFRHRLHGMWQKCLDLAIQGSPEHIKLIAMKAGDLLQEAPNGRGPGLAQVFINVPRPPREPEDAIDVQPLIRPVPASNREQ